MNNIEEFKSALKTIRSLPISSRAIKASKELDKATLRLEELETMILDENLLTDTRLKEALVNALHKASDLQYQFILEKNYAKRKRQEFQAMLEYIEKEEA